MSQRKGRRKAGKASASKAGPQSVLLRIACDFFQRAVALLRSARIQRREKHMQLIERIAVGNKQSVVLLRVDGQEIIVGCSGESMVMLGVNEPKKFTVDVPQELIAAKTNSQASVNEKPSGQNAETARPVITLKTPNLVKAVVRKPRTRKSKSLPSSAPWLNGFSGRVWISGTDGRTQ